MELEINHLDLRYEALRVRSPERDRRILASLSEFGQLVPIVVVAGDEEKERPVVVDGYRRVRALWRLNRDVVAAVEWRLPEIDALLLRRSLSIGNGDTCLEQAWLLDELRRRFGLSLDELARRFDRTPSWVSRRLALLRELPPSIQELIRQGRIVAHAAAKHLVPLARANREQCERLAHNIASQRLSSREVGELYAAWKDAAPSARLHIVDAPQLYHLASREVAKQPPEALGPRTALLEDLAAITAICRRAARRVRNGAALMSLTPAGRDEAEQALSAARKGLDHPAAGLMEAIGGGHAGPGTAGGDLRAQAEGAVDPGDRQGDEDLAGSGAGRAAIRDGGRAGDRPGGEGGAHP
jgi:ParB/RepB/Spo0J family partition protein